MINPPPEAPHPMQQIVWGNDDVIRFRENKIVRYLLEHGPFDLNHLVTLPFHREDFEQLAQLIGYSVSGFGDLSYASEDAVAKADAEAEKLIVKRDSQNEPT